MAHVTSYSSIFNIGHKAIEALFRVPVLVEEKVDGSQFSFGVINGELSCRSKGADLHIDAPEKMFLAAVATARRLEPMLRPDWTYRGEYLAKPKHNTLACVRIPASHVILFDIERGPGDFLDAEEKREEAGRLGLEIVPALHAGMVESAEVFRSLLSTISVLGGQKIEGVVVKPMARDLYGPDKKLLMGKYVSEEFKEVHAGEWRKTNPTSGDVIQKLIERYKTPARWAKAAQHLRERGALEGSVRDIGALLKEVKADIRKEEESEIKDALFAYAWQHIERGVAAGLPQWWKDELVKQQFEGDAEQIA